MSSIELLTLAVPLVWIGLVVGLSFIETPLKFRAPGMTVPLGLAIGRLVFRVVGRIELVAMVVLSALLAFGINASTACWWWIGALGAIVLVQQFALRPRLALRTDEVLAGEPTTGPRSRLHLWFVVADLIKLVALGGLAVAIAAVVAP